MRKVWIGSVLGVLLGLCLLPRSVLAGDSFLPFTFGADLTYTSEYMWRGLHCSDDSFQWDYYVSYKGLTANVWYSMDMTDQNDNSGRIVETDYTLDYSSDFGFISPKLKKLGFSLGYIYYAFPQGEDDNTQEVYVGLSYDTFLTPSLTAYFDIEQQGGCYLELGLGQSFSLPYNMSLDLAGVLGYSIDEDGTDDGYYDDNGFTHAQLTATLNYSPLPYITISPFGAVQLCIDDNVQDQDDVGNDIVVWGGLTVNVEF